MDELSRFHLLQEQHQYLQEELNRKALQLDETLSKYENLEAILQKEKSNHDAVQRKLDEA